MFAASVVVQGCSLSPGSGTGSEEGARLERVAVIPFAFRGLDSERPCDLCSRPVSMKPTSRDDAAFVSAFFFEQLTGYPQLIVANTNRLDQLMDVSMSEGLQMFRVMDDVDAVVVGALVELRERVGSPFSPRKPAGVTLYAELIDARTRKTLWSGTFDADQKLPGGLERAFGRIVNGGPRHWDSALVFARTGAHKLVASMMARAFSS